MRTDCQWRRQRLARTDRGDSMPVSKRGGRNRLASRESRRVRRTRWKLSVFEPERFECRDERDELLERRRLRHGGVGVDSITGTVVPVVDDAQRRFTIDRRKRFSCETDVSIIVFDVENVSRLVGVPLMGEIGVRDQWDAEETTSVGIILYRRAIPPGCRVAVPVSVRFPRTDSPLRRCSNPVPNR